MFWLFLYIFCVYLSCVLYNFIGPDLYDSLLNQSLLGNLPRGIALVNLCIHRLVYRSQEEDFYPFLNKLKK